MTDQTSVDQEDTSEPGDPGLPLVDQTDVPPGNHALEVAARRGIGPLSPLGREVWHGRAKPCVSCGQIIVRDALECDQCGQDHSEEMLAKMRAHAGPWYVLEHVRPFPGVSLERIVRQIRRGLITETSIVRGPPTDNQWRFAVEAPGLCRYFERCWECHARAAASESTCPQCGAYLSFTEPAATSTTQSTPTGSDSPIEMPPVDLSPSTKLVRLSAAVGRADVPEHEDIWDSPARIGGVRTTWIVATLLVVMILALMWFTRTRETNTPTSSAATHPVLAPSIL